jgi:N utilization substance protein A
MPIGEEIASERYRIGQRLRVYVYEVRRVQRNMLQIMVSRTHRELVRRLFESEVPEIYEGTVEIKGIAREPGSRTKMAVMARQEGLDPIGSCVGVRGSRINNVVNELNGEKIDIIQWSPDMPAYVANALSPVKPLRVVLHESDHTAEVVVPEKQLSLAIGKDGQNARLAARLTGWRVDVSKPAEGEVIEEMFPDTPNYNQNASNAYPGNSGRGGRGNSGGRDRNDSRERGDGRDRGGRDHGSRRHGGSGPRDRGRPQEDYDD